MDNDELRELLDRGGDYERRMAAARRRAEWEIGDASWAGVIIGAFLNPEHDGQALAAEKDA